MVAHLPVGTLRPQLYHLQVSVGESILYRPHDYFSHGLFFAFLEYFLLVSLPSVVTGSVGLP